MLNALHALKARVGERVSALPGPTGALHGRLNVTAVRGGEKGSAVPGRVELLVNRRYLPEESAEAVRAEIEACVADALRGGIALGHDVTLAGHLAPVENPDGPHWPRWQSALSAGWGFPPDSFRRWGASSSSDMGWVQQAGIREILLGAWPSPNGASMDPTNTPRSTTSRHWRARSWPISPPTSTPKPFRELTP